MILTEAARRRQDVTVGLGSHIQTPFAEVDQPGATHDDEPATAAVFEG